MRRQLSAGGLKGDWLMKVEHLILISIPLGFFTACADQPTNALAAEDSPEIFAIGRYVLPTNGFWDLDDHVESMETGGIKYDSEFRHPHLPIGGLVVDCELTHRIGVTLAVANPPRRNSGTSSGQLYGDSWSKRLKVKYHWSHDSADDRGFSKYVLPSPLSSGNVLSSGLTLAKKDRIDGIWTVAVTYLDKSVYQTNFQLVGCPSGTS